MTIFLSSGFTAASSVKTATAPVTDSIRKIEPGPNAGQMQVWPTKYPGAGSYEVRCGQVPAAGGTPGTWLSQFTSKNAGSPGKNAADFKAFHRKFSENQI